MYTHVYYNLTILFLLDFITIITSRVLILWTIKTGIYADLKIFIVFRLNIVLFTLVQIMDYVSYYTRSVYFYLGAITHLTY